VPQKLDELVAVATAAGLTLRPGDGSGKFQLKQPKKVFSLVPLRSESYQCAEKDYVVGSPPSPSWSDLTNAANNQILMHAKCSPFAYALKLRSPEGVLYYLGQLARLEEDRERALLIHICDYGQWCGPNDGQPAAPAGTGQHRLAPEDDHPPLRPLFVALQERTDCSHGVIEVQSAAKKTFLIPRDSVWRDVTPEVAQEIQELKLADAKTLCSSGRSMMALDMAAQLIGLQKTAKDFSTTTTVKLVGQ